MGPHVLLAGLGLADACENRLVLSREVASGTATGGGGAGRRGTGGGAGRVHEMPKESVAQSQLRTPALEKLKGTYAKRFHENAHSITVHNSQQQ